MTIKISVVLLLDLSAAVDTIDQEILLSRLDSVFLLLLLFWGVVFAVQPYPGSVLTSLKGNNL